VSLLDMLPRDLTVFFTDLNYLSILLLAIFAIVVLVVCFHTCLYIMNHRECPLKSRYTERRLKAYDSISVIYNPPHHEWRPGSGRETESPFSHFYLPRKTLLHNHHNHHNHYSYQNHHNPHSKYNNSNYKSHNLYGENDCTFTEHLKDHYKDPDTDSLLTVTTASDGYTESRLSLNGDLSERVYLYRSPNTGKKS